MNNTDRAAKARFIAAVILLPIVWLIVASTLVALIKFLPRGIVEGWTWLIVIVALVTAFSGTQVVIKRVMRGERISD